MASFIFYTSIEKSEIFMPHPVVSSNAFTNLRDNKDGVSYVIIIKGPSSALIIKYCKALFYALFVFLKIWT